MRATLHHTFAVTSSQNRGRSFCGFVTRPGSRSLQPVFSPSLYTHEFYMISAVQGSWIL